MKEQSFLKKNLMISMIFGIIIAIFGIVLLFQGAEFFSLVVFLYGLISIFTGVKGLIFSSNLQEQKKTKNVNIFSSVFSIIIGIIIIAYPYFTSSLAINIIIYLLAAQLLISGLGNLFSSFGLKNTSYDSTSRLVNGLINIVIAAVFFIFPSQVAQFFLKVIGVICIFYGTFHFLWSYRIRKVEKEFAKKEVEGEFEKVD
jgi:uncharacterized membrane protein HdeD (DUF308 family)